MRESRIVRSAVLVIALSALLLAGCGSSSDEADAGPAPAEIGKLEPTEVRSALRSLPFDAKAWRVNGPAANVASFRGRAHGPHNTTLEFSVGLGAQPRPIPVPGSGVRHVVWADALGFVFNDDSDVPRKFKTAAQWRQVAIMAAEVNGSLCRAATGEPCPI